MTTGLVIDLLILVLAMIATFRGWEIGLIRQLFSTVGFFLGLFIGAAIQPHIINLAHTVISRSILTLVTTIGLAFLLLFLGELLGIYLKTKLHFKKLITIDNALGSIISLATTLFTVWLCAALITSLAIPGLQAPISQSYIVSNLNRYMPNAPTIVSELGSLIDPNGFPQVFIANEPPPTSTINLPSLGKFRAAVARDEKSIVKIQGLGCGGIVEGSGFVIGTNLVATNAHVVAGIRHPYVLDANGSHSAKAIWFDPNLDFAVLEVSNLAGQPLLINDLVAKDNTPSLVLGYPGGGPLSASTAAVLSEFDAIGRNIYGKAITTRSVYEIEAKVVPGNSGGPLIDTDGRVLGVVFAESTVYSHTGYALTANQISPEISQAESQLTPVSTGTCAS